MSMPVSSSEYIVVCVWPIGRCMHSPECTCRYLHSSLYRLHIVHSPVNRLYSSSNEIRLNPADLAAKFKTSAIGSEAIWFLETSASQNRRGETIDRYCISRPSAMTNALSSTREEIEMLLPSSTHSRLKLDKKPATFQLTSIKIESSEDSTKALIKSASGASLWYVFCDSGAVRTLGAHTHICKKT